MTRFTHAPRIWDADAISALDLSPFDPQAREVVAGAAACAPYLRGLTARHGPWLAEALAHPETALDALRDEIGVCPDDGLGSILRRAKAQVALLTAILDLGGAWPLETVTRALSDFADLSVHAAMRAALRPQLRRGKIPGHAEDDIETGAGLVALAMGKMGAGELNYSSDIDLIALFDGTRFDHTDLAEARAGYVKAVKSMAATLSKVTEEGYVFRTDLRLRPDPSVTGVAVSTEAAERYYESLGRTWERAAYIKARPSGGDLALGEAFLKTMAPFIWRKHLDYAALADTHAMRLAIRTHKNTGGPITLPGHNMKLGRGGIREIEFFAQTQQLISGGRDPALRIRGTVPALRALTQAGWVQEGIAEDLIDHYRFHRTVEHRLQMVQDAQTHALPNTPEGFGRLAAMMGRDEAPLREELYARLEAVHAATEPFFAPEEHAASGAEPAEEDPISARWETYPAMRSERGAEIFAQLKPQILHSLAQTDHPKDALRAFDGFLAGLPAGVQLFSLFKAKPELITLLVDIVGTAPALGAYLARNSGVLDAVIGGGFWEAWPGMAALAEELENGLAALDDYERKLDHARRWAKEWHFRIGVHHLRGLSSGEEAGARYADLAEAVLRGLWPHVTAQFAQKHGIPPGRGAVLLGMGSLGARRLTAVSDLDLILIYDPADQEMSEGRRPLPARSYYAKLTQALVTALSAQTAEGRLYEVDMRLRPSGTQGPVATSLASFDNYQRNEAWVWEHLALTRARVVAGAAPLAGDVEAIRRDVLSGGQGRPVLKDVAEMRARLAAAKPPQGDLDPKAGVGRLQDIELFAQAALLLAGAQARDTESGLALAQTLGLLDDAAPFLDTYGLQAKVQMALRLVNPPSMSSADLGPGSAAFLCQATGAATLEGLLASLDAQRAAADRVITRGLEAVKAGEAS